MIGSLQSDPFSPSHVPEVTLSNPSAPYAAPNKRRRDVTFGNSDDATAGATREESEPLAPDTVWSSEPSLANQSSGSTLLPTTASDITIPLNPEDDQEETEVANTIIRKRKEAQRAAQEEDHAAASERERDTRERKDKKKKHNVKSDQVSNAGAKNEEGDAVIEKRKKKKKKVDV